MARRRGPYASTAVLAAAILLDGEEAYDIGLSRKRVGDGATPGGIIQATKPEVDAVVATAAALQASKADQATVTALAATVDGKAAQSEVTVLAAEVALLTSGQGGGLIVAASWAALSGYATGTFTVGMAAEVAGDAGTHTDPVSGAVGVSNTGRFRWSAAPAGWERTGDLALSAVESRLTTAEGKLPRVFRVTATDALLKAVVLDAQVWGAFDFEDFYLRREFYDYGPEFNKWAKLDLHGPTGSRVAFYTKNNIDPATAPEWVFLTNVVNGAVQAGYEGFFCALRINWLAVAAFGWNDLLAGFAGSVADSGLERSLNRPPEAVERFLQPFEPYATTIAGVGGTEASVASACTALHLPGVTISRSTFPNSNLSNPATPRRIQVIDGAHDETITPVTILGIQTGLVQPHYSEIVLPPTGILRMAAGGTAPVIEQNHGGIVRGGRSINEGDGYCAHLDGDQLPRRGVNPVMLRERRVHLWEDHTFEPRGLANTACGIGGAATNGMHAVFRRCNFVRGGGTAPHAVFHTVPNTTDPALIEFEDCDFEDGFISVQFLKKHETAVRHRVSFKNCRGAEIQCVISGGIGGGHAFQRTGDITGFAIVSANLDPS